MSEELTKKTETALDKAIAEFRSLFDASMAYMEEAARVYVRAIDSDPQAKKRFAQELPQIPQQAWTSIEAVGRGALDKRLLIMDAHRVRFLTNLPLSDQRKLLDEGMELLLDDGDTLLVKVKEATVGQLEQVIGAHGVRTLSEQKALLEYSKRRRGTAPNVLDRMKKRADDEAKGYCLTDDGNVLVLRDPPVLRLDEMKKALKELRR